jgi:hypothetical protein
MNSQCENRVSHICDNVTKKSTIICLLACLAYTVTTNMQEVRSPNVSKPPDNTT